MELLKEMETIVSENVKEFKSDLNYDLEVIREHIGDMQYVWIVREFGTHLIEKKFLEMKDTLEATELSDLLRYEKPFTSYLVNVNTEGELTGLLEVLNYEYLENLLRNARERTYVDRLTQLLSFCKQGYWAKKMPIDINVFRREFKRRCCDLEILEVSKAFSSLDYESIINAIEKAIERGGCLC